MPVSDTQQSADTVTINLVSLYVSDQAVSILLMENLPDPGHSVTDGEGTTWKVSSVWSETVVLTHGGLELVINASSPEQLFRTGEKTWAIVRGNELELATRQRKAIADLEIIIGANHERADEAYEAKYQDILPRPVFLELKRDILRKIELEKQRLRAIKRQQELAEEEERQRVLREKARQERKERQAVIESQLSEALSLSLVEADQLNAKINGQRLVDYPKLKSKYVKNWLAKNLHLREISDEQADAIGDISHSYLLRARAGSGKTRVVVTKAALLMGHERISPDQLMILAFNRKAAAEATKRVRKDLGIIDFNNSRTFHSLAYQLVQPKFDLLFDANTGSTKKQSQFVQDLLNSVLNPAILAQIYLFFRKEMRELETLGAFMSDEDYYTYRRNCVQESLRGEHVKSIGEKWIADFLFEHDIRYAYEAIWFWDQGGGNYQPDFSLYTTGKRRDIVIEHWGIDLHDARQEVPAEWDQTWEEYREQIDRKRAYWERLNAKNRDQQVRLLETSIRDLRDGREVFEGRLATLLRSAGLELRKLSDEELQEKVVRTRIGRFSSMCLQYIQKAKKQRLDPKQMAEKIASTSDLDFRTKSFLRVANNLFRRYQQKLAAEGKIDFDDLMAAAISRVHETKGDCQVRIQDDRFVAMNELRWIMIDEYQDFSPLFFELIDAIRTYNPSVSLFCVGDDWQAINAFAGSDLRYFEDFQSWVRDGQIGDLRNNYRSAREIVAAGNRLMEGKGKESVGTRNELAGKVEAIWTDKIWIEARQSSEFSADFESDRRFQTWVSGVSGNRKVDTGMRIAKMLKKCHAILTQRDHDSNTTFAILSRIDRLGTAYPNLGSFKRKLKSTLTREELDKFGDFDSRVHCGTVHSYKGLEASVVIILGVNKRNFPKIHPDNELHSIFGVTPTTVLAEEERLFYVAVTRAEKELYLLTETDRESEFLSRLGLMSGGSPSPAGGVASSWTVSADDFDDDIPF